MGDELEVLEFRPYAALYTLGAKAGEAGLIDVSIEARDQSGRILRGCLRVTVFRDRSMGYKEAPEHPARAQLTLGHMTAIAKKPEYRAAILAYARHHYLPLAR